MLVPLKMEEKELEILTKLSKSQTLANHIVQRSKLLSYYLSCEQNKRKTSRDLNIARDKIYNWVRRWEAAHQAREQQWEYYQQGLMTEKEYQDFFIEVLSNKPRSGAPPKFTASQKSQIVALGLQNPQDLGLPFTHWTGDLLKREAISRGIVKEISSGHINLILKKSAFVSA